MFFPEKSVFGLFGWSVFQTAKTLDECSKTIASICYRFVIVLVTGRVEI